MLGATLSAGDTVLSKMDDVFSLMEFKFMKWERERQQSTNK